MPSLAFPDPPLTDGVVLLRASSDEDVPQMVEGFSDPLCQRYSWAGTEPYGEREMIAAVQRDEELRLAGSAIALAIADAGQASRVWGRASLIDVDLAEQRAAVGYWLVPQARGQGIASRAVRLLARWAFDGHSVARLELACEPDNAASQGVAERCGFVREGVLRSYTRFKDERRDSVVFSLLPGELR